ncbi:MAG: multidrug effflux MFS transporter [Alphaproteobacteria bacterium]|jgi:DHA1 family bicyclomycin/chloramphenicol resistance-like MFS transporter|tara:strand:- start:14183 stop:15361 length:1179 start_codon:yes stop_codon:yes gene_type:complete
MRKIQKPPSILALAAVTGLAPFTLNIIVPSLPSISENFDVAYSSAQLVITAFIAAMAIGQLIIGTLSDAYGRRSILMIGIFVFIVGSIICSIAPTIEMLIFGRFIQALGGVSGVVLGRAIVRDVYGREKAASALGYVTTVMVIAPMIAPVLGGLLEDFVGWRSSFYVLFFTGILLIFMVYSGIKETNIDNRSRGDIKTLLFNFIILLRIRKFVLFTLTMACANSMFFTFLAVAPFIIIKVLEFSPTQYGFAFIPISVAFMLGSFTAARLSERIGSLKLIKIGVFGGILGSIVMGVIIYYNLMNIYTLFGSMMIITYSNGIVMPNIIANIVSVKPELAGAASGLSGSMQFALAGICTYTAASISIETAFPMAMQLVLLSLIGTISFLIAKSSK